MHLGFCWVHVELPAGWVDGGGSCTGRMADEVRSFLPYLITCLTRFSAIHHRLTPVFFDIAFATP